MRFQIVVNYVFAIFGYGLKSRTLKKNVNDKSLDSKNVQNMCTGRALGRSSCTLKRTLSLYPQPHLPNCKHNNTNHTWRCSIPCARLARRRRHYTTLRRGASHHAQDTWIHTQPTLGMSHATHVPRTSEPGALFEGELCCARRGGVTLHHAAARRWV